jgi:hypothetical protein
LLCDQILLKLLPSAQRIYRFQFIFSHSI